jgi:ribonuclease HI
MEVRAALEGLRFIAKEEGPVQIFTDSTYLIRGITQWVWGWKKKSWKTAEGKDVLNKDLWEDLIRVVAARGSAGKIEWTYVRGHMGNPGNERCDEIAVAFSQGRSPRLYRGPVKDYDVDVLSFPEAEGLPEMRPKEEKKPAHSYLSVVDGVVMRHKDWASCEKRVKGRSGAKFKKSQSAGDESEILSSWGESPSKVVDDK